MIVLIDAVQNILSGLEDYVKICYLGYIGNTSSILKKDKHVQHEDQKVQKIWFGQFTYFYAQTFNQELNIQQCHEIKNFKIISMVKPTGSMKTQGK